MQDIETTIVRVKQFAETFEPTPVTNEQELSDTSTMLGVVKDKLKKLESIRKEFTADLNAQLKKINARFKEASDPLESMEKGLKIQIQRYYDQQHAKALEELKRIQSQGTTAVATVEAPATTIRTAGGVTSVKRVWTFTVENISEIPREFLAVDEKKIREAIAEGKREIPGVKIFQETSIAQR